VIERLENDDLLEADRDRYRRGEDEEREDNDRRRVGERERLSGDLLRRDNRRGDRDLLRDSLRGGPRLRLLSDTVQSRACPQTNNYTPLLIPGVHTSSRRDRGGRGLRRLTYGDLDRLRRRYGGGLRRGDLLEYRGGLRRGDRPERPPLPLPLGPPLPR